MGLIRDRGRSHALPLHLIEGVPLLRQPAEKVHPRDPLNHPQPPARGATG